MEERNLMTETEIHDFGVEVVFSYIQKEGYEIESVNTDMQKNPQIVARKDGNLCFIIVRTACYPNKGEVSDNGQFLSIIDNSQKQGATPYFASVGICNADAKDEKEASTPYKGSGFNISFDGLLIMTTEDKVSILK